MAELMTATITMTGLASKALVNKKYLPKNPAKGGIPAIESKATIIANANNGFRLAKPLNTEMFSEAFCSLINIKIVKATMVAMEYAVK